MADVQNIITLGVGSTPGNIKFFVLLGLDAAPPAPVLGTIALTADSRSASLTADSRSGTLTLDTRPQ